MCALLVGDSKEVVKKALSRPMHFHSVAKKNSYTDARGMEGQASTDTLGNGNYERGKE
jgi:hypothetical protein